MRKETPRSEGSGTGAEVGRLRMGRAARGGMSSVSPRAPTRSRHAARWVARRSPQHLGGRLYVYLLDTRDTNRDEVRNNSYDMLVARLENENEFLRRELERKDTILLNMTEAMKALNPPAREPSENAPESPESPGPSDPPTERDPRRAAWRSYGPTAPLVGVLEVVGRSSPNARR